MPSASRRLRSALASRLERGHVVVALRVELLHLHRGRAELRQGLARELRAMRLAGDLTALLLLDDVQSMRRESGDRPHAGLVVLTGENATYE